MPALLSMNCWRWLSERNARKSLRPLRLLWHYRLRDERKGVTRIMARATRDGVEPL
jgi:hypothetical protein